MNTEQHDELISAVLDGERVDADALRLVLADPEAQRTLAAFLLLRAAAAGEDDTRLDQSAVSVTPRRWRWFEWDARVPATLAASLCLIAVALTLLLGPARRDAATPSSQIASAPAQAPNLGPRTGEPPRPTRTLHFTPGVNWTSASR